MLWHKENLWLLNEDVIFIVWYPQSCKTIVCLRDLTSHSSTITAKLIYDLGIVNQQAGAELCQGQVKQEVIVQVVEEA